MPFIFTHALFLSALSALAIPVLLHLFLKRKRLQLPFSTLRFFAKEDNNAQQWRRLRRWLLLALRLLIITALVIAFARPYQQNQPAKYGRQLRRNVALVIDRSASLQARDSRGRRWERLLSEAQQRLSTLQPDDHVAMVVVGPGAEVLAERSAFSSPGDALKRLEKIEPGLAAGELVEGLARADALFGSPDSQNTNEIWVFSDFQRNSCDSLAEHPIRQDTLLVPIQIAEGGPDNLAVTGLRYDSKPGEAAQLTLTSFAGVNTQPGRLKIELDGHQVNEQSVALPAGSVTNISFPVPTTTAGWHSLRATFDTDDSLAPDNTRVETFFVAAPIRVLAVEPRSNVQPFQEETLFVARALSPTGTSNTGNSGFEVAKIGPQDLVRKLQQVPQVSVVVLPGLNTLPAGLGRATAEFVRKGGGLLLFLNEKVNGADYNHELADLLPARLRAPERESIPGWRLQEFELDSPVFALFQKPGNGSIAVPEFTRRFSFLEEPQSGVLARFHDGEPAILLRTVGLGKVLLVNSSADTAWNDWPRHRIYLPWIQTATRYLARREAEATDKSSPSLVVGEESELQLGPEFAGQQLYLKQQGFPDRTVTAATNAMVLLPGTLSPGACSMFDAAGHEVMRLALNVPVSESDLATMSADEFARAVPRRPAGENSSALADNSRPQKRGFEDALFLSLIVFLLAELTLANRTLT